MGVPPVPPAARKVTVPQPKRRRDEELSHTRPVYNASESHGGRTTFVKNNTDSHSRYYHYVYFSFKEVPLCVRETFGDGIVSIAPPANNDGGVYKVYRRAKIRRTLNHTVLRESATALPFLGLGIRKVSPDPFKWVSDEEHSSKFFSTWIVLIVLGLKFLLLNVVQLTILKLMNCLSSTEPVKKGRVPRSLGQAAKCRNVPDADVQKVFDFWVTTLRSNKSSRTKLDEKRKLFIGAAIHDYGIEDCMKAITGCSKSPFHMGANRNKKRYDSLELIFRDADHIEKFCDITEADGNLGAKGFLDD